MESVRNCVDYGSVCRRRLRRFGLITSNDVLLDRGLQDDEDDRALRWKCRERGYISIIQLLQCVAQTCAVCSKKLSDRISDREQSFNFADLTNQWRK